MTVGDELAHEIERIEKMWRAESDWDSVEAIATEIAQSDVPLFRALDLLEIALEHPLKFAARHVATLGQLKGGPRFLSEMVALDAAFRGLKLGGLRAALQDMQESDDDG